MYTYGEVSRRSWDAKLRIECMDDDGIDVSVLYPTQMLAIQGHPDVDYAVQSCRAYNDWLSDHCAQAPGRLYGVAVLPQQDIEAERGRACVGSRSCPPWSAGFLPPESHRRLEAVQRRGVRPACGVPRADTNLALGFHPYLDAMLPGAAMGLRIGMLRMETELRKQMPDMVGSAIPGLPSNIDNMAFSQAIANPVDMMTSITFITMGGVCERFPDTRFVFLEANGGWIVPWLERLDHHAHEFPWDMPGLTMKPSEYFRRQCYISFDPDESALPLAATSPLCGADRIVWASDFPAPDAKYPGVTERADGGHRQPERERPAPDRGRERAATLRAGVTLHRRTMAARWTSRQQPSTGLCVIQVKAIEDERGVIREFYRESSWIASGLPSLGRWVQLNVTDTRRGTVRGLHGEAMHKLVGIGRVRRSARTSTCGAIRPTFRTVVTVPLTVATQVLVPEGVCNGFQPTSDGGCTYVYCFDDEWRRG